MAASLSLQEVDLSCPICCDIFTDPVVLKCSHSFCNKCLQQYWSPRGHARDCPLCRKKSTDDPVPSLNLKNLCESYVHGVASGGGGGGRPEEELYADPGEMCARHGEPLKLFCLQDAELICVVCHTSRAHRQHECCPVEEALLDAKEKIRAALTSLQEKKEKFDKMRTAFIDTAAYIQVQARFVERRTKEEFRRLHQFLQEEEEDRLASLRREEEEKADKLRSVTEELEAHVTSLTSSIRELEEELALDNISLLHSCKETLERARSPAECPSIPPGALIDVAQHLGSLDYAVWEKMRGIVTYTPVTMDPNSAAPWLRLSDDLASVRDHDEEEEEEEERRKPPDNPERFDPDAAVLGHRPLSSGRHTWVVDVGDNTAWVVGVAEAWAWRKEKLASVQKHGYLCVYFYHRMHFAGTSPLTRLSPRAQPDRVRVLLDCEAGTVAFRDARDDSLLYTFKKALRGAPVYPYFWVGCKQSPLRVLPAEVKVVTADRF